MRLPEPVTSLSHGMASPRYSLARPLAIKPRSFHGFISRRVMPSASKTARTLVICAVTNSLKTKSN